MTDPQHMDPDEFSPRYDVSKPKTVESLMEQLSHRNACEVIAECHAILDAYGVPPCKPGTECSRQDCNSHLAHRIHAGFDPLST